MKPVIKEYGNKRNHELRNMTKNETVNLGYRILETSNFQIKEKMKTSIMKQTLFSDSLQNEMLMIHTIFVQNNNLYWYKSDAWTNLQSLLRPCDREFCDMRILSRSFALFNGSTCVCTFFTRRFFAL